MNEVDFSTLVGHKIVEVNDSFGELFITTDRASFRMRHDGECCEQVELIDGLDDLRGLVGETVVVAAKAVSDGGAAPKDFTDQGCSEWTFYMLRTANGDATLRWFGSSNGYYSTDVKFYEES